MNEPKQMTTWRRNDGGLIGGEYSFVTGTECLAYELDAGSDLMEYVEEVWELRSYRYLVVLPRPYSCEVGECDEDAVGWRAPTPRRPWRQACKKHGGIDYDTLHYPDSEGRMATPWIPRWRSI